LLKRDDNKVGVKEYTAILILTIGLKATDTNPTAWYKIGKNAGWMIPIFSLPIALLALYCLLRLLKRYKDKNYIEIIYELTGNHFGLIISFIIFLTVTSLTAVNTRGYVEILSTLYFPRTPIVVLAVILVASSFIMCQLGFEAIGRTAWMVLPWILIALALFLVLIFNILKVGYLFPLGGAGIGNLIEGGITNSGVYSEFITFAVVFPQLKGYKDFKIASYFVLLYSAFMIPLLSAIYVMVMDYPAVVINNYPFHAVSRLIYGGRFISNMESFFLVFWIISSLVRFGIYIYTNTLILCYTLKLRDGKALYPTISALILALSMIPENYLQSIIILRRSILNFGFIPMFIVPVILLFLSRRKEAHTS
jgi:spore germination protein KB